MIEHVNEIRLNDYADGTLAPDERGAVEAHLAACLSCRAEADALRGLLRQAAELPVGVEPARDLWPDIANRIQTGRPTELQRRRQPTLWQARYWLAAAAVALIGISSVLTVSLVSRDGAPPRAQAPDLATGAPVELVASRMEADYGRAIGQLIATLDDRRDQLPPETVQVIDRNLRIIDRAIGEIRTALEADPASAELVRALAAGHQAKLELLRRAVQAPAAQI